MTSIGIVEREMTEAEFARMNAGFDEHAIENGNHPLASLMEVIGVLIIHS